MLLLAREQGYIEGMERKFREDEGGKMTRGINQERKRSRKREIGEEAIERRGGKESWEREWGGSRGGDGREKRRDVG